MEVKRKEVPAQKASIALPFRATVMTFERVSSVQLVYRKGLKVRGSDDGAYRQGHRDNGGI